MTNTMRASVLIRWTFLLQSILIVSAIRTENYQTKDEQTSREVEAIRTEESISGLIPTFWTSISIRNKRSDEVADKIAPTRHSKHRKRRRCRNRPSCFRGTSASRLSSSRNDNTEHHKMKNEDYDVAEIVEDKSKIDAKEKNTATNKNTSIADNASESDLMDTYDDRDVSEEIELEKSNASSKTKGQSKKTELQETIDYKSDSPFYIDDQVEMPESLGALLSKLFQSLRNASATESHDIFKELNFVNAANQDPCQKWLNSKDKLEKVFLGGLVSLPACPCQYPSNIFYEDKIWDEKQKKHFRWRDVSGNSQRLDIYKPGAAYCIRSLLTQGSGSAAAQHCCYDRDRKLLTRGSGAGTPNFVSPEISPILHERIDILPWRLCKGDFSRYNGVRPPNNDNGCGANPDDEEYQRQIDSTKYY